MRLVITDTGNIWNPENPYLKKYKDIVQVICLNGEKATEEYECIVVPNETAVMGQFSCGTEDPEFRNLTSFSALLDVLWAMEEDVVFLTDTEPSSLCPFQLAAASGRDRSIHLIAMSQPWFSTNARRKAHREALSDLSRVKSLLYYDTNQRLEEFDQSRDMNEFLNSVTTELGELLPKILYDISNLERSFEGRYYFDFCSLSYVSLEDAFEEIDPEYRNRQDPDFDFWNSHALMGKIVEDEVVMYPNRNAVESLVPRLDGKKVCNILREQRMRLATANGIPFESEECPSIGPCAGTCEKCDQEARELWEALKEIPEEERVYPYFDAVEEVELC